LAVSLSFAKTLASCETNSLSPHPRFVVSLTPAHAPAPPTDIRALPLGPALPSGLALGDLGSPTAAQRPQEAQPQTECACPRKGVLGRDSKAVVWLEALVDHGQSGDCGALASRWLSIVLVMAIAPPKANGAKADEQRTARTHLPHGGRESNVGSAPDSRRTAGARFRYLGTDCVALGAARTKRSRAKESMEDISQEQP